MLFWDFLMIVKSIQQTKHKIMAKNLIFGTSDHSKNFPVDFGMIHMMPNFGVQSSYAIISRSNTPKSRKPPFWHLESIKIGILRLFNDPHWTGSVANVKNRLWNDTYDLVVMPNFGEHIVQSSYALTSRSNSQKSRNTLFGTLDHSKMLFWHI